MPLDADIPHADLTYRIIGCAMRVHTRLGPGLKEHHYQRALTAEVLADGMAVSEEHHVEVYDGDQWIECHSLFRFTSVGSKPAHRRFFYA